MSERNVIKIVIDTNVWISFLIGKSLDQLFYELKSERVEIYFSSELQSELFDVISRPKFRERISDEKRTELIEITVKKVKTLETLCEISDCRDPKDNFLLDLAVSANADYLVTGDNDLLDLDPFRGIRIIDPGNFEELLHERGS